MLHQVWALGFDRYDLVQEMGGNHNLKGEKMNIRKKDIAVSRNHSGALLLSTVINGYLKSAVFYDTPLKWARADFINSLKNEAKNANRL